MSHRHLFAIVALICGCVLVLPDPGRALVDIPTKNRDAYATAELAACSGVALPQDLATLPLDDVTYLLGFQALKSRGLFDPTGARLQEKADRRQQGRLEWHTLRPLWELRAYTFASGISGDGERSIYHSNGDTLEEGFNAFLSATGQASWSTWLAGAYELQLRAGGNDIDYATKRLYAKAVWGKWSFKVGRDAERLGPGYHSSLLLDDTAATMNLWRVRTEEPLFFPGSWSWIGGFRFALFNGYLSDDNPSPTDPRYGNGEDAVSNPNLLGLRGSYHPTSWLDLGLSRTVLYSGDGRETYNTLKDWWELLTGSNENPKEGESTRYDNDQYVALDITVRLPALNGVGALKGGKFYWEYAATDIISKWQGEDTEGLAPFNLDDIANLGGLYLTTAVTDFRIEYAQTSAPWYRNGEYPQGYTFQGVPLGHHMGGDARNWFFELSRYFGPRWKAKVYLDLEERGRSLKITEKRSEWLFGLDAREVSVFDHRFTANAVLLLSDIENSLTDPKRASYNEYYLGFGISGEL